MDYLKLFIFDGIFGSLLQSIGYLIMIYACNKKKINMKTLLLMSVIFAVTIFAVRRIGQITYGLHTILIMLAFILISMFVLKMSIYPTVCGTLLTTIIIVVVELIELSIIKISTGEVAVTFADTIQGDISKAKVGIPINIVLIIFSVIFYKIMTKHAKE